jgi:hypothetical protein
LAQAQRAEEVEEEAMSNEIPRRICMDKWTAAERKINDALQFVECMPAHTLLTDAVVLLQQAQATVADYVDNVATQPPAVGLGWKLSDEAKKDIAEIERHAQWGPKP